MKIYKFFQKVDPKKDSNADRIDKKYVLYAVTNKKRYADEFIKQRNMKKFLLKVDKGVDIDEWTEIANTHRGEVLSRVPIISCEGKVRTKSNRVGLKILMTYNEKTIVEENQNNPEIDDPMLWDHMPPPFVFSKGYRAALDVLQYTIYFKILCNSSCDMEPFFIRYTRYGNDDLSTPEITLDELSIFIGLFNSILR